MQQGFAQQFDEIVLAQPQQDAATLHRHRGVARAFGDQRLFAKGVAGLQFGQRELDTADLARHRAAPALDQVVIIADITLAQDALTALAADPLEAVEQGVDVGWRQMREHANGQALQVESSGHQPPVGFFRRAAGGRAGFGELIPGHHDVERFVIDAQQADVGNRLGRPQGRQVFAQRPLCFPGIADQHTGRAVGQIQLDFPGEQPDRLARRSALKEGIFAARRPFDGALPGQLLAPGFRKRADRLQSAQKFGHAG